MATERSDAEGDTRMERVAGERLFLDELGTIERVLSFACRRNSLRDADAEDFCSWVKLKLIEDDYAVVRRFEGRSFAAYISMVIHRLLLDYRIHYWGKWHTSAEARRQGEVAIALEVMLYRDGRSLEEALPALLRIRADLTKADAERIAASLPMRSPKARLVDLDGAENRIAVPGNIVEDAPLARERASLWRHIGDIVAAYLHRLSEEDRTALRMRFGADLTVAEIARNLRLKQKPLYRRLERHLAALRRRLQVAGIHQEAVRTLLEHPLYEIDFTFLSKKCAEIGIAEEIGIVTEPGAKR